MEWYDITDWISAYWPGCLVATLVIGVAGLVVYGKITKTSSEPKATTIEETIATETSTGCIVNVDEESVSLNGSGSYNFEILRVDQGSEKVSLIYPAPANYSKYDEVQFEYEVLEDGKVTLKELVEEYTEGRKPIQDGVIKAKGIIVQD